MVTSTREEIRIGPLAIRFLLEGEESGGSVAVFEFDVPAGVRLPGSAHSHDGYEETIYGLEGVLSWTLDERQTDVGPGEVLCIPRGVVHRFDNDHDADAKMLAVSAPASSGPTTSAKSPLSSEPQPAARPTRPRSPTSCDATASPQHRNPAQDSALPQHPERPASPAKRRRHR